MQESMLSLLKSKIQRAKDCEYAVRHYLDESFEIPRDVKHRLENDGLLDQLSTSERIYLWKENFLKTIGKNPFNVDISEYSEDAIKYMEETSPYCFGIDTDDMMLDRVSKMSAELALFALSQGATDEQVSNIPSILREKKISIPDKGIMERHNTTGPQKVKERVKNISGTVVEHYQSDNLLGTITKLNDKNIAGFISYLMRSNALANPDRFLSGVCIEKYKDKLFVSEGNHRIFVYQALQTIRKAILGDTKEWSEFSANIMIHHDISHGQSNDER